jgi:hypothetical protein
MEIHKNTNKQLNDLLNEARHEKPVMNLREVENIISEGKYTPSGASRGFHIGMNNMIVVCGIVVSSFLAYMALKVDKGDLVTVNTPAAVKNIVTVPVSTTPVNQNRESAVAEQTLPASAPSHETENKQALKTSDRVQPKQNPATLVASSDKNIVATENENNEAAAAPVEFKMPSGEYVITFNYNGQDIRMKLVGDEVSEFSVDGHAIAADQYGDFDDILAEGKNYLIGNTHSGNNASSLNLIKYFDNQLRADHILDQEVQYKFELSSSQLTVNGVVQSNDIFKKYKGLYEAKTGKTITKGSSYKFERGAKSE